MREDFWTAVASDGATISYGYKELTDGIAAISAKADGRFLMILEKTVRAPLTRKQVEAVFEQNFRAQPSSA
jgi:hypothetical protein